MADEMDPNRENQIKGRTNEESMIDTVDDEEFEDINDDSETDEEEDLGA